MADLVPEGCEKCIILRVINPGVYWVAKSGSNKQYKKELQHFDHMLSQNVEKISFGKKVPVGKIIAVKIEAKFHKGIVTDVFNRSNRTTYLVLLIDYGNMIEVSEKEIYSIKNQELINKKSIGIKVSITGIQPVALDVGYDKNFLDEIFHKRVQGNWSPSAYKFVQLLFDKNPHAYLKHVHTDDTGISGEIYFIEEPDKVPISLSQKLCDNGFAVFSEIKPTISIAAGLSGGKGIGIEEKIPERAISVDIHHTKSINKLHKGGSKDIISGHLAESPVDLNSQWEVSTSEDENASNFSLTNTSEMKKSKFNKSRNLCANTHSSSWILKKHFLHFATFTQ